MSGTPCVIRPGIFDRFFLQHPRDHEFAWSGSQWVAASPDGYPTGMFQICNFETEAEAREYCAEHGLEPE